VRNYGREVAASGLPVQICPVAAMLVKEQKRGRLDSANLGLADDAEKSFRRAFERLDGRAQLLLRSAAFLNPQRIPREELFQHLQGSTGWSKAEFLRLLDACLDLHLIEGKEDLRIHQLFGTFVLSQGGEMETILKEVRSFQARRLIEIAGELGDHLADTELAAAIMVFPLRPDEWLDAEDEVSIGAGETIGRALREIGRFTDALPWCERAVEAMEKGDVHGRVDQESLAVSLSRVAECLRKLGRNKEADEWEKRAAALHSGDDHSG